MLDLAFDVIAFWSLRDQGEEPAKSDIFAGRGLDVDLGPGRLAVVLGPVRPDVSWALTASVGSENKRHR